MSDFAIPSSQREFRCIHCNGKIAIPKDLLPTTGPCPHCKGKITSPEPTQSSFAAQARSFDAPPEAVEAPVRASAPSPGSGSALTPMQTAASPQPAPAPAAVPARVQKPPASASERFRPKSRMMVPMMLVALVVIAAASAAIFYLTRNPSTATSRGLEPGQQDERVRTSYLRSGWESEARTVLEGFLAARTAAEKLPYILNGPQLAEVLKDFYGGASIDDSDTPVGAFSAYKLSMDDRERGIFLMEYNRPTQFDFKEFFFPLAPMEVQYDIEEADLLLSHFARAGNFTSDPVRVRAFFKSTPDGLKLDWEIFAQTKYRTFLDFVELPGVNERGIFRVFIVEDVPEQGRDVAGFRTYCLADPANTADSARVKVKVDSDLGKELSVLNWRGIENGNPTARTATVELVWTGGVTGPLEIEIERFICWEFLGIGGQAEPTSGSGR